MADNDRNMDRKAVFEPYDMDTAIGTNNSGVLMFSPYLEDTDTVDSVISGGDSGGSNAPVYNAQDSVIWNNLRDAFRGELTQMYRSLRASKAWSYEEVVRRFKEHQAIWPEAIFNEDSYVKYLTPLVNPVTVDEETGNLIRTDRYLTMLQGSKEEQRKWWLYNRFRYLDSKYDTGNASSNIINIRFFNDGVLKYRMAIPGYAAVSFGGGTTPSIARVDAGEEVSFPYVAPTGVTEMETWIHSGNLVTEISDLSIFYPNECDFSKATLLRSLKIGDATPGYSNANLTTLNVQNSPLLEYLDVRNCPRLAITLNLENSPRLAEAYFDGTAITGVDLADGCIIETLHLPSTVTALTLLNLTKLSEFVIPDYSNITRLMLANMDMTVVPLMDILEEIPANSQVNIQGLYLELADSEEINEFYDLLDTMTGVTRERNSTTGEWVYHSEERANVSGEIHTAVLTGEEIEELNGRYPYIRVTANHTTCYLYYYNYDGSELLYTETVLDGGNGVYAGQPTRAADARYTYTFAGWSTAPNGQVVPNARNSITRNKSVYAAYTAVGQKYRVRFYNSDGTLLQTVNDILYGGTAQYTGASFVHPEEPDKNEFAGWSPSNTNITSNTDCYPIWLYTGILTRRFIDRTISGPYTNSVATKVGDYAFYNCSRLTEVYFPEALSIGPCGFINCSSLSTASFPKVSYIGNGAFQGCGFISISFPQVISVSAYGFYGCNKLVNINLPNVETLKDYAFQYCYSLSFMSCSKLASIGSSCFASCARLSTVSFPNLQYIGLYAFSSCTMLTEAVFPRVTNIYDGAFFKCSAISIVSFPELSLISNHCFAYCSNLSSVSFPEVTKVGQYAFRECYKLTSITFPKVSILQNFAFVTCPSLSTISLPMVTELQFSCFWHCSNLMSVILATEVSTICTLGTSEIFNNKPSLTIYVPDSLVTSYQTATNWTYFSSQIKGVSELSV